MTEKNKNKELEAEIDRWRAAGPTVVGSNVDIKEGQQDAIIAGQVVSNRPKPVAKMPVLDFVQSLKNE